MLQKNGNNLLPVLSLFLHFINAQHCNIAIQFMSRYTQGLLPITVYEQIYTGSPTQYLLTVIMLWLKRDSWRAENSIPQRYAKVMIFIFPPIAQTERQPYFMLPRLWCEFEMEDIKSIRNVKEFNFSLNIEQTSSDLIAN